MNKLLRLQTSWKILGLQERQITTLIWHISLPNNLIRYFLLGKLKTKTKQRTAGFVKRKRNKVDERIILQYHFHLQFPTQCLCQFCFHWLYPMIPRQSSQIPTFPDNSPSISQIQEDVEEIPYHPESLAEAGTQEAHRAYHLESLAGGPRGIHLAEGRHPSEVGLARDQHFS